MSKSRENPVNGKKVCWASFPWRHRIVDLHSRQRGLVCSHDVTTPLRAWRKDTNALPALLWTLKKILPYHCYSLMLSDFASNSPFDDDSSLEHVVNHVFFPVYLPEKDNYTRKDGHTLVRTVHATALAYGEHLGDDHKPYWLHITKMLENLRVFLDPQRRSKSDQDQDRIIAQLDGMRAGGTLGY